MKPFDLLYHIVKYGLAVVERSGCFYTNVLHSISCFHGCIAPFNNKMKRQIKGKQVKGYKWWQKRSVQYQKCIYRKKRQKIYTEKIGRNFSIKIPGGGRVRNGFTVVLIFFLCRIFIVHAILHWHAFVFKIFVKLQPIVLR